MRSNKPAQLQPFSLNWHLVQEDKSLQEDDSKWNLLTYASVLRGAPTKLAFRLSRAAVQELKMVTKSAPRELF